MSDAPYQPRPFDVKGLDLIGYRQPDGTILLGGDATTSCLGVHGVPMPDFPPEIKVLGAVYTLEDVKRNKELSPIGADHPGYNIEWGVYV